MTGHAWAGVLTESTSHLDLGPECIGIALQDCLNS